MEGVTVLRSTDRRTHSSRLKTREAYAGGNIFVVHVQVFPFMWQPGSTALKNNMSVLERDSLTLFAEVNRVRFLYFRSCCGNFIPYCKVHVRVTASFVLLLHYSYSLLEKYFLIKGLFNIGYFRTMENV